MLPRCPLYVQEGCHQGGLGANKWLLGTSTCRFLVTKQENIFKANCLSRRWMQQWSVRLPFPRLYFGRFPCRLLTDRHARACTHTTVANYRKRVMSFLVLPLPLILCYINYILLQTYTVLVVSAPSIHGNSQWVPTLRHTHPHTANLRCRNARLTRNKQTNMYKHRV